MIHGIVTTVPFPLPQNTFQNSIENYWGEDVAVFDPFERHKSPATKQVQHGQRVGTLNPINVSVIESRLILCSATCILGTRSLVKQIYCFEGIAGDPQDKTTKTRCHRRLSFFACLFVATMGKRSRRFWRSSPWLCLAPLRQRRLSRRWRPCLWKTPTAPSPTRWLRHPATKATMRWRERKRQCRQHRSCQVALQQWQHLSMRTCVWHCFSSSPAAQPSDASEPSSIYDVLHSLYIWCEYA